MFDFLVDPEFFDISIQIQPHLALHCGTQFWFLRDPRDQVCLFSTIL